MMAGCDELAKRTVAALDNSHTALMHGGLTSLTYEWLSLGVVEKRARLQLPFL
jgi:hypothetical protein